MATPPADDADATLVRPLAAVDPDATVIRPLHPLPLRGPGPPLPALPKAPPLALPVGLRLHEYRIDGVLGQGGFGITYLATDVHLHAPVAIKEYLPEEIAYRSSDRSVSPNASRHRDRYQAGLDSFLVEARTLASFRHPNIVRVARFFEAHRTAYMVLEYEKGQSLKRWWPEHSETGEDAILALLQPLLDGLAVVHGAGFLHRDIKPDNIQVRADDGRLVLLDFGSAGQTVAVADQAAVVVTPGYAPPEQYGLGPQGAWTDLYALGATLYWMVGGRKPPDAEQRSADPAAFKPAAEIGHGRYGEAFLKAIDWALEMDPAQRPPDIHSWRRALFAGHAGTLGLKEALRSGDTLTGAEAVVSVAARWPRRLRQRLATLVQPAAWPLALKMTLAMVLTALLPMLLTGVYNLRGSQAALTASELGDVELAAHGTAGRLAQWRDAHLKLTKAIASDSAIEAFLRNPTEAALAPLRSRLLAVTGADPDIERVMLLDREGKAVISSDDAVIGTHQDFRDYVQLALTGQSIATGAVVSTTTGRLGVYFAVPVGAPPRDVAGVVVLRIAAASFVRILDELRHDSTLTPFLVDGDGVIAYHPDAALRLRSLVPLAPAALAEILADRRFGVDRIDSLGETALAGAMLGARAAGHLSYRSAVSGDEQIAGFAPVEGHDWVVGVSEPRAVFDAPMQRLFEHLMWSLLLVGLLFTGLALRFARSIVRPITALTDAALALKAGDFEHAHVEGSRRDEVGTLARTFNVMIDVLRQRERERRAGGAADSS